MAARVVAAVPLTSSAFGSLGNAKVIQVRVDANGSGMVIFDQPMGGSPPGCVISFYNNALSFNAPTGKSVIALALFSKATGTLLTIYGDGTYGNYGSYVENWAYGQ